MKLQPHLIHVHCMAHRLALCSCQAADAVPVIKSYQQWLTNLFNYFSQSRSRKKEIAQCPGSSSKSSSKIQRNACSKMAFLLQCC
jgi:hypothetical protein